MLDPYHVVTIEEVRGPEEWEGFTDDLGRTIIQNFWDTHKVDKETRGL
jgi:hypothetical protein